MSYNNLKSGLLIKISHRTKLTPKRITEMKVLARLNKYDLFIETHRSIKLNPKKLPKIYKVSAKLPRLNNYGGSRYGTRSQLKDILVIKRRQILKF